MCIRTKYELYIPKTGKVVDTIEYFHDNEEEWNIRQDNFCHGKDELYFLSKYNLEMGKSLFMQPSNPRYPNGCVEYTITKKELIDFKGDVVKVREYDHTKKCNEIKERYRNAVLHTFEIMMTGEYEISKDKFIHLLRRDYERRLPSSDDKEYDDEEFSNDESCEPLCADSQYHDLDDQDDPIMNSVLALLEVCPKSLELAHATRGIFEYLVFKDPHYGRAKMTDEKYWSTFTSVKGVEDSEL